jgi:hypothetical protein
VRRRPYPILSYNPGPRVSRDRPPVERIVASAVLISGHEKASASFGPGRRSTGDCDRGHCFDIHDERNIPKWHR